jgi:hypothetical protein
MVHGADDDVPPPRGVSRKRCAASAAQRLRAHRADSRRYARRVSQPETCHSPHKRGVREERMGDSTLIRVGREAPSQLYGGFRECSKNHPTIRGGVLRCAEGLVWPDARLAHPRGRQGTRHAKRGLVGLPARRIKYREARKRGPTRSSTKAKVHAFVHRGA